MRLVDPPTLEISKPEVHVKEAQVRARYELSPPSGIRTSPNGDCAKLFSKTWSSSLSIIMVVAMASSSSRWSISKIVSLFSLTEAGSLNHSKW